jgi:hypothetical protein
MQGKRTAPLPIIPTAPGFPARGTGETTVCGFLRRNKIRVFFVLVPQIWGPPADLWQGKIPRQHGFILPWVGEAGGQM